MANKDCHLFSASFSDSSLEAFPATRGVENLLWLSLANILPSHPTGKTGLWVMQVVLQDILVLWDCQELGNQIPG